MFRHSCWKNLENERWVYFNEKTLKNPVNKQTEEQVTQYINQSNHFFFSHVNFERKGSKIYTKDGYGIVYDKKQNEFGICQGYTVRLNSNNILKEYNINEILFDFQLDICLINNNIKRHEKLLVSVASTTKNIIDKASEVFGNDYGVKIIFKGKELKGSNQTIEGLEFTPQTKLIGIITLKNPLIIKRFQQINTGWCYSSNSTDGISFQVNRDTRVYGYGIFNFTKEANISVKAKFCEGNSRAKGLKILLEQTIQLSNYPEKCSDEECKIYKFLFNYPILVKAQQIYSCIIEIYSASSFYGGLGQTIVKGDNDIIFQFCNCDEATNGSTITSGQIPEIYYYS